MRLGWEWLARTLDAVGAIQNDVWTRIHLEAGRGTAVSAFFFVSLGPAWIFVITLPPSKSCMQPRVCVRTSVLMPPRRCLGKLLDRLERKLTGPFLNRSRAAGFFFASVVVN